MGLGLIRWMRKVVPRGDMVTACITLEMMIECAYLWCVWQFGVADESLFRWFRFVWLSVCAGGYGVYRIAGFHPVANPNYRAWLEQTPWTPDKPLPCGPLQLVPQDLLVVCGLAVLYRTPSMWMLYFPTIFLVGYQSMLAICGRMIGHWRLAYSLGFGLGAVMLFIDRPEYAFAAADACFIIGRIAVSRALATFPWDLPWQADFHTFKSINDEEKRRRLGWPYDQMKPTDPKPVIPLSDGICVSFLIGWWWFVVLTHLDPEPRAFLPGGVMMATFGFAIARIAQYALSHRSPISFFGRLFTLRWIIPGYDQIFVAPLIAVAASSAIQGTAIFLLNPRGFGFPANPWPGMALSAAGLTFCLLILLNLGPQLESWRMSGKHRIVFDLNAIERAKKDGDFVEL